MVTQGWRGVVSHHDETYVGGSWVPLHGEQRLSVVDPSNASLAATVRESSEDDVAAAVVAAGRARPALAALSPADRAVLLQRLAGELERRTDVLAAAITTEMGMPVKHCVSAQVTSAIRTTLAIADAAGAVAFERTIGHSRVVAAPVGVVGAITPWNYPLLQAMCKVAAAIAAGCPVVLKPSEVSPLDALILAEASDAARLPPGALNLVFGTGPHVGEALVRHADVAMVSLTGSTRAGRRVAQLAANTLTRVTLELGGKSPAVILDDADLASAVEATVRAVMINSGQTCTAPTRLLVPFQLLPEAEQLVEKAMQTYRVGAADDPETDVGPVAGANQLERVHDYLARAELDGARMIWSLPPDRLPPQGYFVAPAAYSVSDPQLTVAQEEVFGPVLVLIPFVTEGEAVEIANGTPYGLAATVWSPDLDHARAFADRLEAGTIDLNGARFNNQAPFGGVKQSGYGRELGADGILEFTQTRSVQLPEGAA